MKKLQKLLDGPAYKDNSGKFIPFTERGPIDRNNLGPFVRGYLHAMLKPFPFHDIEDVAERLLSQVIRDCIHFYYANHRRLEALWNDPFEPYKEQHTGRDFWLSRNMQGGFMAHTSVFGEDGDMIWLCLEASAIGFGNREKGLWENDRAEIDIDYTRIDPTDEEACNTLRDIHEQTKT